MPFAVPDFIAENGSSGKLARDIARVVAADLTGTGLFRELSSDAYISKVTSFDAPVAYNDWQAINTEALVTGAVSVSGASRLPRPAASSRAVRTWVRPVAGS